MLSTFYPVSDTMRAIAAYATAPDKVRIVSPKVCVECAYDRALLPKGISHVRAVRTA